MIEVTIRVDNIIVNCSYSKDMFGLHPWLVVGDIKRRIDELNLSRKNDESLTHKIDNSGMDNFVMPV